MVKMSLKQFQKHQSLPFAECRHTVNSGRHYKPHMHKTFSVGAIDRGEVIYQVGKQTARLRPGSLALINPEILHSCNPSESCERSYYMLYLDVDWCLQVQQSLWQLRSFRGVNQMLLEDNLVYEQYIATMKSLMDVEGELLRKEQMLVELSRSIFLRCCEPGTRINESSLHVESLKLQLGKNLEKDIALGELAADLQVNPYTLLRNFKTATGITPHAYRLNCRIELARKLLQEGEDLAQVALECGFFDQSHFHRHFKAMTTVTPREYQVNFIQ